MLSRLIISRSQGWLAVCEEAKFLLMGYLDAAEEYDRLHLVFLAACRRNDLPAVETFRGRLREAKNGLQAARGRFQQHQKLHKCCEAIHFEDETGGNA